MPWWFWLLAIVGGAILIAWVITVIADLRRPW